MIRIILVSLIFSANAYAVPKKKVPVKTAPSAARAFPRPNTYPEPTANSVGPIFGTGIPAPTPEPVAPKKSPFKLSYYGEVQGPALGNLDINKTQTPGSPAAYSEWDHSLKLGYQVVKNFTLGTQFRAASPFDPAGKFGFADQRFYGQWSHMIETSDIDMSGKLTLELPTTDRSRTAGKIFAFKFDENFTLKTSLRNWSFTTAVMIKPTFFNDPVAGGIGKNDLNFGIFPYITMDISPNVQLLFEASFDGNHNYTAGAYDYQPGDPDYIDIGPIFTLNSHVNTNVALRFFTEEITFNAAALYINLEAAL